MAGNQKCCDVGWDMQDSLMEWFLRLVKPEGGKEGALQSIPEDRAGICT